MNISTAQVETYRREGYLIVEDILNADELQEAGNHIEAIAEGKVTFPEANIEYEPGASEKGRSMDTLRKINMATPHDAFFQEYVRHPGILEVVTALLGPDIKLFGDQTFMKPPGGVEKPYHQDSAYFKIEPTDLVTAWMALDDVTLKNGCLWVVPGSHQQGILDHSQEWAVRDRIDMKVPDKAIDLAREVPITLRAGSCSFHHSVLLHRSGTNRTPYRRRGLAVHYMSASSRWTGPPEDKPDYIIVQGSAHAGCV